MVGTTTTHIHCIHLAAYLAGCAGDELYYRTLHIEPVRYVGSRAWDDAHDQTVHRIHVLARWCYADFDIINRLLLIEPHDTNSTG